MTFDLNLDDPFVLGCVQNAMDTGRMRLMIVDTDGLPDDWEIFYLNTLAHGGTNDPDNDDVSNLAEFRAGTDPFQAASVLRLSLARRETGEVRLRFPHAASRRYSVEFTENFNGWTALSNSPVFDLSTWIVNWADEAPESSKRFYRVRSELTVP